MNMISIYICIEFTMEFFFVPENMDELASSFFFFFFLLFFFGQPVGHNVAMISEGTELVAGPCSRYGLVLLCLRFHVYRHMDLSSCTSKLCDFACR